MEEPIEATLTWVWRAAGRLSDNDSTQRDGAGIDDDCHISGGCEVATCVELKFTSHQLSSAYLRETRASNPAIFRFERQILNAR
jgi:hypothetical protein